MVQLIADNIHIVRLDMDAGCISHLFPESRILDEFRDFVDPLPGIRSVIARYIMLDVFRIDSDGRGDDRQAGRGVLQNLEAALASGESIIR